MMHFFLLERIYKELQAIEKRFKNHTNTIRKAIELVVGKKTNTLRFIPLTTVHGNH